MQVNPQGKAVVLQVVDDDDDDDEVVATELAFSCFSAESQELHGAGL